MIILQHYQYGNPIQKVEFERDNRGIDNRFNRNSRNNNRRFKIESKIIFKGGELRTQFAYPYRAWVRIYIGGIESKQRCGGVYVPYLSTGISARARIVLESCIRLSLAEIEMWGDHQVKLNAIGGSVRPR